ncbi:hypothetical protein ACLE20_09855 [Rhizobium sp. YIM 134829]|uniref:hypothetical protein n=1 Tax=Rhizobium sp. YIM 134829 TaxID=3390453 RepID=UPI00397BA25B
MAPVIARSAAAALADGGTSRDRSLLGSTTRRFDTILHVLEVVLKDLPAADPDTRMALARLTEALGQIVNLPPQPQEGLAAFAKRLIAHMEQMPPAARALLDKQLTQQSLIAALKLLVESLKNGNLLDLLPKGEPLPPMSGPHLPERDETPFRPPVIQQPLPVHAAATHPSTVIGSAPELQAALRQAYGAGETTASATGAAPHGEDQRAVAPEMSGPVESQPQGSAGDPAWPVDEAVSAPDFWDQGPFAGDPIPTLKEAAAFLAKDLKAMARAVEITWGAALSRFAGEEPIVPSADVDLTPPSDDQASLGERNSRPSNGQPHAADHPQNRRTAEALIGSTRPVPPSAAGSTQAVALPSSPDRAARSVSAHPASIAAGNLLSRSEPGADQSLIPGRGPSLGHGPSERVPTETPPRVSRLPERGTELRGEERHGEEEAARLPLPRPAMGPSMPPAAAQPAQASFDEWETLFFMLAGPREDAEAPPAPPHGLAEQEASAAPAKTPGASASAHATVDADPPAGSAAHAASARLAEGLVATPAAASDALATLPSPLPAAAAAIQPFLLPFLTVPYAPLPDRPSTDEEAEPQHQEGQDDTEAEERRGEGRGQPRGEAPEDEEEEAPADAGQLYRHLADLA